MIAEGARLTEIIMVQKGTNIDFFTKEGVYIGSIREGTVTKEEAPQPVPESSKHPKSGVLKGPTPDEIKIERAKENEKIMSASAEEKAKSAADKSLLER